MMERASAELRAELRRRAAERTPSTVSVNGLSIFRWCRLVYVCPCLARIFSLRFSSLPAAPFSGTGGPGVIEWSRRLGKRTIVREKERRRLREKRVG